MQIEVWKTLLRRVPADQFDNLMMMTAQGTEINVQTLLRMEDDYMLLRGRIAGSSDAGRIFILPYVHLDHVGFQRPLSDAQLQAIFDGVPIAAAPPTLTPEPAAAPAPPLAEPAATPAALPAPPEREPAPRVPTKSDIIRRLRLRSGARDAAESPPKE